MLHQMKLNPAPFDKIVSGTKTFELRLNDEKRQRLKAGDEIVFFRLPEGEQTVRVKVIALHLFASFAEMYAALPLEQCGYLPEELPNASPEDMNLYYSPEKQERYGVLAIEVRVI